MGIRQNVNSEPWQNKTFKQKENSSIHNVSHFIYRYIAWWRFSFYNVATFRGVCCFVVTVVKISLRVHSWADACWTSYQWLILAEKRWPYLVNNWLPIKTSLKVQTCINFQAPGPTRLARVSVEVRWETVRKVVDPRVRSHWSRDDGPIDSYRPCVAQRLERPLGVREAWVRSSTASHQRRKTGSFARLGLALGITELGNRLGGSESV